MTLLVTVSCNGTWPGKPCGGRIMFKPHMSAAKAREKAAAAGWSYSEDGDLCPAHTRAKTRDRVRRGTP